MSRRPGRPEGTYIPFEVVKPSKGIKLIPIEEAIFKILWQMNKTRWTRGEAVALIKQHLSNPESSIKYRLWTLKKKGVLRDLKYE